MTDNLDNLRSINGFPKGKDEDLLALSNPPYYTAYPNPHIGDFIQQYGSLYDEATDVYHREPFVIDVSEGKNDQIYNAHTYHTKVPYKAIIPFIEHYTKPGEIVFDGFCGSGMTGIAAQTIGRNVILNDLSPAATFISYNFNTSFNLRSFDAAAKLLTERVKSECNWMYETKHVNGEKALINFTIWSDVFICPYCKHEFVFWDEAVDIQGEKILEVFPCPNCKATLDKKNISHASETFYDDGIDRNVTMAKQKPVIINYSYGSRRYEKRPDDDDIRLIEKISKQKIPYWFPSYSLPKGFNTEQPIHSHGLTHCHHFFTRRNLWCLATQWDFIRHNFPNREYKALAFAWTGNLINRTKMNRWPRLRGPLNGTLYIPSISYEMNPITTLEVRLKKIHDISPSQNYSSSKCFISTQSSTTLRTIPENSCDYIFIDPPFGGNIMYSELNFLWESWLAVTTQNESEAIINDVQNKDIEDYHILMTSCFREMYRILKPGRWITIEFHNSKASVWNVIQEGLAKAGFLVAQVTVLDKQQGSFKQVTSAGAVKNDLVINAYKPRANFENRFSSAAGIGLEAEFVKQHLFQLPIAINIERSQEMLYSKYLAYYVQHGYQVMYNGEQFYLALAQWGLEERDGYWFADEAQANEYEKRKAKTFGKGGIQPQAVLFVSDERSARQWIWNFLDQPKTYDEIYTDFLKALQTSEDEIPEVKTILEESFVRTNGHWKRPDQLTQAELEKKRQERLLRQFEEYLSTAKANQKLKEVRLEAVIAGFTECYRSGRYKDILLVGKKLDKAILENSSDLYDFIDIAEAKVEG